MNKISSKQSHINRTLNQINKDWKEDIPIESRFKTLLADWKRKNQTIGELKAYIDELEFEIKNLNNN